MSVASSGCIASMVVSARAAEVEAAGGGGWAYRGPLEPPDKAICRQLSSPPGTAPYSRRPQPRIADFALIWIASGLPTDCPRIESAASTGSRPAAGTVAWRAPYGAI